MSGKSQNVCVCCKIRPQSKIEDSKGSHVCVTSTNATININGSQKHSFSFDRVFSPEANQAEVFEEVGENLVSDLIDGFNCTLFAYGQSGAGKTFTMEGPEHTGPLAGLTPRIVHEIFEKIKAKTNRANGSIAFAVKVSVVT